MKVLFAILLLSLSLQAESVRLAWDAPNGPAGTPIPQPSSYAVLIYSGANPCSAKNWNSTVWENTNSTQTTYVVTRPPGCYEFTISYYLGGQIQGTRSNFLTYTIKAGETARPAPVPPAGPANLRITIP